MCRGSKEENGNAVAPDIAPGAKGALQINLPTNWKEFDVLYVTVKDAITTENYLPGVFLSTAQRK